MKIQVSSAVSQYVALSQIPELNQLNNKDTQEEIEEEETKDEGKLEKK